MRSLVGDVKRPITTEGGSAPRWFRDGTELFYHSGNGLFAVEVSTHGTFERGLPPLLFEGPYQWALISMALDDVTADAQRFLMITQDQSEATEMQLNVVLNWFEELNTLVPVP